MWQILFVLACRWLKMNDRLGYKAAYNRQKTLSPLHSEEIKSIERKSATFSKMENKIKVRIQRFFYFLWLIKFTSLHNCIGFPTNLVPFTFIATKRGKW